MLNVEIYFIDINFENYQPLLGSIMRAGGASQWKTPSRNFFNKVCTN